MARRRLVDPRMWQSGHFKRLNFRQRILWIGLITLADDDGKLRGDPAVIKSEIFPFDRVSLKVVDGDLQRFSEESLIQRYEVSSERYIHIVKWAQYQRPSHPTPSRIPDPLPPENSGGTPELLRNPSGSFPAQGSLGKDSKEQVSKGQDKDLPAGSAAASAEASDSPAAVPQNNGDEWPVREKLSRDVFQRNQFRLGAAQKPNKALIEWLREWTPLDEDEINQVLNLVYAAQSGARIG